ncbi:hypothetical protein AVEN_13324-1 [Araneus ventricosus]|uniref:Uncharacterized protein n=1 Tax=Araneus ventricosus TaxID=182803 RepID=A0A4Y2HE42_ARAVE|nr:hypothetical protein AVEN_13324-1 [Araneus ventricosus]
MLFSKARKHENCKVTDQNCRNNLSSEALERSCAMFCDMKTLLLLGGIHDKPSLVQAHFCLRKQYTVAKSNTATFPDIQRHLEQIFESSTSRNTTAAFAVSLAFEQAI